MSARSLLFQPSASRTSTRALQLSQRWIAGLLSLVR